MDIIDVLLYTGLGSLSLAVTAFVYGLIQNKDLQEKTTTASLWNLVVYDNR